MDTSKDVPALYPTALIERFTEACESDARIVAAFLGGSHAAGTADEHSDIDFCIVTTDEAHTEFMATREEFIRRLGEPLFLESFDNPFVLFFILDDGSECELATGKRSDFLDIHGGPFRVLYDPSDLLDGVTFPWSVVDAAEQHEALRQLIDWYWHDFSHFTTAMGRGQLLWAYGQLESLRRTCIDLARLRQDFSAPLETYDKIEKTVPTNLLAPLADTFCPMQRDAMLASVATITQFYRDLAQPLAHQHGLNYPTALDRIMSHRLESMSPNSQ